MATIITFPKAANGTSGASPTSGSNGTDAIFTQNGKIGADSLTVQATGQAGGDGGTGVCVRAPMAATAAMPPSPSTATSSTHGPTDAVDDRHGRKWAARAAPARSRRAGQWRQRHRHGQRQHHPAQQGVTIIALDAIAVGGIGPNKRGNAIATVNGNIIQPSKGAANVELIARATVPGDASAHDGDSISTKATLNGNIVQGNISGTVTLAADTWLNPGNTGVSNGTANINGNIVQPNATSTALPTVEAPAATSPSPTTNSPWACRSWTSRSIPPRPMT